MEPARRRTTLMRVALGTLSGLGAAVAALVGTPVGADDALSDPDRAVAAQVGTEITTGQTTAVVISAVRSATIGRPGAPGALRFEVRNTTAATVSGIQTRFELQPGVSFRADGSSQGCRAPATQVLCDVATLGPGATAEVAIALTVDDPDAELGSTRRGVLLAPLSEMADLGAGEIVETGPVGTRVLVAVPGEDSESSTSRRWTTEIRPIFTTARLCAVGLRGTATLRVAGAGAVSLTGTGGDAAASSDPLPTTLGAVQPIEIEVTGTRWSSIGLIGDGETCSAAAAGALGVNGRWRYRLPVQLTVGSSASARLTGAVWGARNGRPLTSVRVHNAGPDPAALELQIAAATPDPSDDAAAPGCVRPGGSAPLTCHPPALGANGVTTLTVTRDSSATAPWSLRLLDGGDQTVSQLPAG